MLFAYIVIVCFVQRPKEERQGLGMAGLRGTGARAIGEVGAGAKMMASWMFNNNSVNYVKI